MGRLRFGRRMRAKRSTDATPKRLCETAAAIFATLFGLGGSSGGLMGRFHERPVFRGGQNPGRTRSRQPSGSQGFASGTDLLSKSIQLRDGEFPKIQNNCQNRRNRYNLSDPCDRND